MKTATITDFRQKMKKHLDEIQQDQDFLVLTGPKRKDFVVLTLKAFNAMEETAHLLSTTANAKRLMESIAQAKAGKATTRNINLENKTAKASPKKKIVKAKAKKPK
ncbi:MAG: type II toxin-antitoxin system Phd/YefM family antitoxin [Bacteroidota bacterium]